MDFSMERNEIERRPIGRPRQVYQGAQQRDYIDIAKIILTLHINFKSQGFYFGIFCS
jgi:hypothetical protein